MLVLICYGLSVVVSRFFFLSGKKERRLFGLRLLSRFNDRGNFIL